MSLSYIKGAIPSHDPAGFSQITNTNASTSSLWGTPRAYAREVRSVGGNRNPDRRKMSSPEPSRETDVNHLQKEGSETEETGGTGTGELVGGALEGGWGAGRLWCDDGANGGPDGSWSWGRGDTCLRGGGGWGDGCGEWHGTAAGEGTLGHGDGLAGGGSVGRDRW